jgi:hypothetical protein
MRGLLLTTQVLTGLLLLVLPVAYNGLYTLLARSFDYPDILRGQPARSWSGSPPAAAAWSCCGGGSP